MSITAMQLVAEAKAVIRETSCEEVSNVLSSHILLDVREPEEFAQGHLPGAINIPRGLLEFRVEQLPALQNRQTPFVVYCQSGGRSALAAKTLASMGWHHPLSMAGGYKAWTDAGYASAR